MDRIHLRRGRKCKEVGRVTGAMCAVSGVLLIAPLLPIIYERWERFYMLDQEAKLIRTALKKRQDLEGKEKGAQGRRGSTREAREGAKEEVDAAAGGVTATVVDGEGDDEAFLTRQRSLSSTVGESGIEVISDDPEIQKEIKNEDDVVWAHIRAASLKRMQSQTSFKRLKKEGSISEVPEPPPSAKGSEDSDSSDENYDNDDDDTGGHVDNDAGDKKGSKVGSSPKPDRGSSADSAAA